VRAVVIVLLVAIAPLLVVGIAQLWDFGGSSQLLLRLEEIADDAVEALATSEDWDETAEILASDHRMRVRILDSEGRILVDHDHQEDGVFRRMQGPLQLATSIAEFDADLGPILVRPEFAQAKRLGWAGDCRTTSRGEHLVCHSLREMSDDVFVYLQDNAPLSVRELIHDRSLLMRLTALVLPIALVLALWLAWRILVPIEQLRAQLVAQADLAAPGMRLITDRGDELGDLAGAFNAVLERLADRERTHEAFVADLAHEFKSPVAAVQAVAERLEGREVTPERAERLARILGDSARRLEALLDHLLAIARAEAGLDDEEREAVDIAALLQGICAAQRLRDPETPIDLEVEGALSVSGVPGRLESVLRNLIENAASFGAGETVTVRAVNDGRVRIDVVDRGPGIDPEDLPRIFDRFFTTREGARGTGLGLALVKAVIEAHGGSVTAMSEPGAGAVFTVALPVEMGLEE
jgi:two-component system sensor histidine kinase ChvG